MQVIYVHIYTCKNVSLHLCKHLPAQYIYTQCLSGDSFKDYRRNYYHVNPPAYFFYKSNQ